MSTEGNDLAVHIFISPGTRGRNKVRTQLRINLFPKLTPSHKCWSICAKAKSPLLPQPCGPVLRVLQEKTDKCTIFAKKVSVYLMMSICAGEGFIGGVYGKQYICQYRRHKRCMFNRWVMKIPWRKAWQPTLLFLPGKSHGQKLVAGKVHRDGELM